MKIALYQSEYGTNVIFILDDDGCCWADDEDSNYVRVSKPIDVDFPPLDQAEITNKKIAVIELKIESLRANCQFEVTKLERKKQELLALTSD